MSVQSSSVVRPWFSDIWESIRSQTIIIIVVIINFFGIVGFATIQQANNALWSEGGYNFITSIDNYVSCKYCYCGEFFLSFFLFDRVISSEHASDWLLPFHDPPLLMGKNRLRSITNRPHDWLPIIVAQCEPQIMTSPLELICWFRRDGAGIGFSPWRRGAWMGKSYFQIQIMLNCFILNNWFLNYTIVASLLVCDLMSIVKDSAIFL